jgi:hypothetical protein
MTIEIDQGKTQKILIFPDSDPEELSYEFCKCNNLDFGSMKYLKQEIAELVIKLKESHINKYAERIQEIIHEEDENNHSVSNNDLVNKNTSIEITFPEKTETEFEGRVAEKTLEENFGKSKETSKVANAYSNYLCTTSENNFDILADSKKNKISDPLFTTQFSPPKTETKISNVFDKLYQDSRLRRMRSPQFKTYSNSNSIRTTSPQNNLKNIKIEFGFKKTSLLNQQNIKKFYDDQNKIVSSFNSRILQNISLTLVIRTF